jgi:hypothetical protein
VRWGGGEGYGAGQNEMECLVMGVAGLVIVSCRVACNSANGWCWRWLGTGHRMMPQRSVCSVWQLLCLGYAALCMHVACNLARFSVS